MIAELEALGRRAARGVQLGLGAMEAACARVGQPELAAPVVHVAGTNGKGSVSAMVASMARAANQRVGLYTSPHLLRFAERIQIDGVPIEGGALGRALGAALEAGPDLSYFEVATLAAFLAFREANVELSVIEVGLGGRLDATNVVRPAAAAVTRVALDHLEMLGPTLEHVAREKAGIAKPGLDLLVGRMDDALLEVVRGVARAAGGSATRASDVPGATALASGPIGLAGAHQTENAEVAAALGLRLGLAPEAIRGGLAAVRWPGRLEAVTRGDATFLLDAAHNADGATALAAHLAATWPDPREVALVFGALADKSWAAMLDALAPRAARRVYVAPPLEGAAFPRPAAAPADLAARHPGDVAPDVAAALERAAARGRCVVVAGSIFLVGAARALLLDLPREAAVPL